MTPLVLLVATAVSHDVCRLDFMSVATIYKTWATASALDITCVKEIVGADEPVAPFSKLAPNVEFDWAVYTPTELLSKYDLIGRHRKESLGTVLRFESVDGRRHYMIRNYDLARIDLLVGGLIAIKLDSQPRCFQKLSCFEAALDTCGFDLKAGNHTKTLVIPNARTSGFQKLYSSGFMGQNGNSLYNARYFAKDLQYYEGPSFDSAALRFKDAIKSLPSVSHQLVVNNIVYAEVVPSDYYVVHEVTFGIIGASVLVVTDLSKNSSSVFIDWAGIREELVERMYR